MLSAMHWVIVAVYLVIPLAAAVIAIWQKRAGVRGVIKGLVLTFVAGVMLSLAMSLIYATAAGGRVSAGQVFLGGYFAMGMLLLLKVFDWGVRAGVRKLLFIPSARDENVKMSGGLLLRIFVGAIVRVVIVAAVALPYVMSSVMTYRPKVNPGDNPQTQLGFDFERVEFRASDGMKLVGWWIPASKQTKRSERWDEWGENTVLVCHGLGANKSNQLFMARQLVPGGFNVLAFDFRAAGESGGQLSTFGDLERRDVLGAVKWLRENRSKQSQKIFGVGASMGGSALIAAAADDSDEGRAINAVATYAAYDSLEGLAQSVTKNYFLPPLGWLVMKVGVPLASVQTGADLRSFSPAKLAGEMWPRPLLLIHGVQDRIISFEHAQRLYQGASLPKYYLWLEKGDHNDVLGDEGAARAVLRFFKTAKEEPVI
jgi:fermentation-respiration switch protein FrsA (DUF1100 family)